MWAETPVRNDNRYKNLGIGDNMALSDRVIGGTCLLVAVFVFSYYTLWALVTPLFPSDSPIQAYFPPREWAVRLPAILLMVALSFITLFIVNVLRKQAIAKREKELQKSA